MLTVGIDLGTTATVIAVIGEDGQPQVVPVDSGKTSTPSIVKFGNFARDSGSVRDSDSATTVVGRAALSDVDYARTVFSVKRSMGTDKKFFEKSPEEVSAAILSYVKENAERKLGDDIRSAVITVPAHFSDIQRTATKRAASLAGIKVLRLINEPTAAAIAFGLAEKVNGIYAVYDFGGGTFDFSVVRLMDGVFQVLATGGNNYLGGDDVDRALLQHNFERYGIDAEAVSEADKLLAKLVVKNMKEQCDDAGADGGADVSSDGGSSENIRKKCVIGGREYLFELSKGLLQELSASYIAKTFEIADQVLSDAKIPCCTKISCGTNSSAQKLDGVLMVGGMTKLQIVKDSAKEHFGVPILDGVDPEKVVAFGAAIQADAIENKNRNTLLIDVVPLTLGIETFGGGVDRIIHRNTPIPVAETREYTTYADNQGAIKFRVVQGERTLAKDCRSIANFELRGIPPAPRGVPRVAVKFAVDVNGLLSVSACEKNTGVRQSIVVEPSAGLTEDEMVAMLENAFENAEKDREKAAYIATKTSAERQANFWESIVEDIPDAAAREDVRKELRRLRGLLEEDIDLAVSSASDTVSDSIKRIKEISGNIEATVEPFLDEIISERLSRNPVKIA